MLLSQRPLSSSSADQALAVSSRHELAERVIASVRRGRNVLVLGERGSGRTSTLSLVEHRILTSDVASFRRLDAAPWTSARDLVAAILATLGVEDRGPSTKVVDPLRQMVDPLGPREVTVPAAVTEVDVLRIARAAETLVGRSGQLIVLLDNLNPTAAHDLFGRFRDTLWSAPVTWVGFGDARQDGYLKAPADVFWERVEWLEPLGPAEGEELLHRRIEASERTDPDRAAIQRLADNLPDHQQRWSPRDLLRAAAEAAEGSIATWTNMGRLDRAARAGGRSAAMLVSEMEQLGRPVHAADPDLLARLGLSRPRINQLLRTLEGEELVESHRDGRRTLYRLVDR